ncbi:MAG TPA: hypothetical protein VG247_09295 [Pseudonocardiaceae bacterium]|jgi:hypothetical protein|nr:hypothetical protein [Pseudonocardiaceae bacterium]
MSNSVVNIWRSLSPGVSATYPPAPTPGDTWNLTGGTAWVYHSPLNRRQLVRPVILADGFSAGASNIDELWDGLEENGRFRFVSELHAAGYDLILLGYDNRAASILNNGDLAVECIQRAIQERAGRAKLTVGGFSMGGLVTRYALAKLESADFDHQTATYLSYDTPHTGAWLPIGVQAFAHYVKDNWGDIPIIGPIVGAFSDLINTPASRQAMRWHLEKIGNDPSPSAERRVFIEELARVGWWPSNVRKLGVANGVGTGIGNGIIPGLTAVRSTGPGLGGTTLYTQNTGQQIVARIQKAGDEPVLVPTNGLPDIDGAPGGLFPASEDNPGSFGVAALLMFLLDGEQAELTYPTSCFVPSVSAVAAGDIDDRTRLYREIDPASSELDDFLCASQNEGHTTMTRELGEWIVNQIQKA